MVTRMTRAGLIWMCWLAMVAVFAFFMPQSAKACDVPPTLIEQVDNGDGSVTYSYVAPAPATAFYIEYSMQAADPTSQLCNGVNVPVEAEGGTLYYMYCQAEHPTSDWEITLSPADVAFSQLFVVVNGDINQDGDAYAFCSDCNDTDPSINPKAIEICDSVDNDCDSQIDEGTGNTVYYADVDGDGYGISNSTTQSCLAPPGYVGNNDDCDDGNAVIHPGVMEDCDGVDNDCNGYIDEGFDQDGDKVTSCGGDCVDTDKTVYPSATERCDGKDSDCSQGGQLPVDEQDVDGDGSRVCSGDCDDNDAARYPDAEEICTDTVDNDCDGMVNDGCEIEPTPTPTVPPVTPTPVGDTPTPTPTATPDVTETPGGVSPTPEDSPTEQPTPDPTPTPTPTATPDVTPTTTEVPTSIPEETSAPPTPTPIPQGEDDGKTTGCGCNTTAQELPATWRWIFTIAIVGLRLRRRSLS